MPRSIRVPAALAAVVLILVLTLGRAPAAHAAGADRGPAGFGDWLALLWHHVAGGWSDWSGSPPTALYAPEGGTMDPNGAPAAPPPEGAHIDPDATRGPVALSAPEGSDMDPDG